MNPGSICYHKVVYIQWRSNVFTLCVYISTTPLRWSLSSAHTADRALYLNVEYCVNIRWAIVINRWGKRGWTMLIYIKIIHSHIHQSCVYNICSDYLNFKYLGINFWLVRIRIFVDRIVWTSCSNMFVIHIRTITLIMYSIIGYRFDRIKSSQ